MSKRKAQDFAYYKLVKKDTGIYLEIDTSTIPELADIDPLHRMFQSEPYRKLRNRPETGGGEVVLSLANQFLNWVDPKLRNTILANILYTRAIIGQMSNGKTLRGSDVDEIVTTISDLMSTLIIGNDLFTHALKFVREEVKIVLHASAGKRVYDTADKTYTKEDVTNLYALMTLCRVFLPIKSILILVTPTRKKVINLAERVVASVFLPAYNVVCPWVIERIERYIAASYEAVYEKYCKKVEATLIFNGITRSTIPEIVLANILSRTLVINDLNKNLIFALKSAVENPLAQAASGNSPMCKENFIQERNFDKFSSEGEENRDSQLEIDSLCSKVPLDVPIIPRAYIEKIKEDVLLRYKLDFEIYKQYHEFNKKSILAPSKLGYLLIEMLFSQQFFGVEGIRHARMPLYHILVACIQTMCRQKGYGWLTLALTAIPQETLSSKTQEAARHVLVNSTAFKEYRELIGYLNDHLVGKHVIRLFEGRIEDTLSDLVKSDLCICALKQDIDCVIPGSRVGDPFYLSPEICSDLYQFTLSLYKENN